VVPIGSICSYCPSHNGGGSRTDSRCWCGRPGPVSPSANIALLPRDEHIRGERRLAQRHSDGGARGFFNPGSVAGIWRDQPLEQCSSSQFGQGLDSNGNGSTEGSANKSGGDNPSGGGSPPPSNDDGSATAPTESGAGAAPDSVDSSLASARRTQPRAHRQLQPQGIQQHHFGKNSRQERARPQPLRPANTQTTVHDRWEGA